MSAVEIEQALTVWGDVYGLLMAGIGEALEAGAEEAAMALGEAARILRESEDLGEVARAAAASRFGGYLAQAFRQVDQLGDSLVRGGDRLVAEGKEWAVGAAQTVAQIVEKTTTRAGLGFGLALPFAVLALAAWAAARRR